MADALVDILVPHRGGEEVEAGFFVGISVLLRETYAALRAEKSVFGKRGRALRTAEHGYSPDWSGEKVAFAGPHAVPLHRIEPFAF